MESTSTKAWLIFLLFLMAFLVTTEGGKEEPVKDGTDNSDHHNFFGSPFVPCPFVTTCCVFFPGFGPHGGPPGSGSGWPKPDGPKPHGPKDNCTGGHGDTPKGDDGEPGYQYP